jgi:hypothetical protein
VPDLELRIGGVKLDRPSAWENARAYLSGDGGYGYPAYDAFDAGSGPWTLSDGDLLAPVLLNVRMQIPAFYALADARERLEGWLRQVPLDMRLIDAGPGEISVLGELFAVLDDRIAGVGGHDAGQDHAPQAPSVRAPVRLEHLAMLRRGTGRPRSAEQPAHMAGVLPAAW